MDDYIERDKVIDVYGDWYVEEGTEEGFIGTVKQLLEGFPSADVQPVHWIPVSERLPDVGQRVLLSGHGEVMVGMLHSFGKYSLEPTGISYIYPKNDIEAWMPLPEPWKGADDEVN